MSYREKIAWLSLITMALTFVPYFTVTALSSPDESLPNLRQMGFYALTALTQMSLLGLGHLLLRRRAPLDARIPPDERDRAIASRSMSYAYYVMIFGIILAGCIMPFSASGWSIVNAAIFVIVLAEVVRYSSAVLFYRRQA